MSDITLPDLQRELQSAPHAVQVEFARWCARRASTQPDLYAGEASYAASAVILANTVAENPGGKHTAMNAADCARAMLMVMCCRGRGQRVHEEAATLAKFRELRDGPLSPPAAPRELAAAPAETVDAEPDPTSARFAMLELD